MAMTKVEFEERLRVLVGEYLAGQAAPAVSEEQCLATVLEDRAMVVGDTITRELLSSQLSAMPPDQHVCPTCGARGLNKGQRLRTLQTRRGEAEFTEPELYCKKCRRSFFPSVGGIGAGS
jgi:hypothetical protein